MPEPQHRSFGAWLKRNLMLAGLLAVAVIAALWGIISREAAGRTLRKDTEAAAIVTVATIKAASGAGEEEVVLPGTVEAWHEAPIYARTNGYLKNWYHDIGSHVKEGELLAEIETPEIDAQLRQAEADLVTAEANNQLAQTTAARWENLLKTNSVSKQEADEKTGAAKANAAQLAAAQANVSRLQELESFKRVVAPFDGIITARTTDIGALITAGSTTGQILFRIAESDKLRIYVQVPQTYSSAITPDLKANLHFAEKPGQDFPATLYRSADAIDPTARTLLIQFIFDNSKGELLPGGFTEAHLKLPSNPHAVRLPVSALLFRSEGLQAATIDASGHAHLVPLTAGRDFGKEVEILSGLESGETVIDNPPDSLIDGQQVRVAPIEKVAKEENKS